MTRTHRPRLEALRAATAAQHKELDGIIHLMAEDVHKVYYCRILQLFYGFIKSFELTLFSHNEWKDILPLVHTRKKSDKLKSDLHQLGVDADVLSINFNPPPTETFAQALGVMYAMEGSTLGGQMMIQHLTKKFPELSHSYMRGYGPSTGKMWQEFLTALEKAQLSNEEELEMQKAAQATFSSLKKWFVEGLRSE